MTVSIFDALGTMPTGERAHRLDEIELSRYMMATVGTDAEKRRNARHALRDELYRDGGDDHMFAVIGEVFQDPTVKEKRRQMIPHAKFSNCLKRIVVEMSTVYASPAVREVGGSESNQKAYRDLITSMSLDEQLGVVNEMLNLHRALIVGPRIRIGLDGTPSMVLDIATPSSVRAVTMPHDRTHVLGWLVRVDMPLIRNPWSVKPAWVLWTEHEMMYVDENLAVIPGSIVEHEIGMSRWVPISYSAVAVPGFWPGHEGEDLVSARVTEWLLAILMIKETKSNTKQPIVSGDTTAMARSQAADSETPIEAPEGVSVTTVDMGTDPDAFIRPSDHVLERTGNNYGLSMAALKHQGVQSAEAREIMMAPVHERRAKQEKIFRRFEAQLARVMSAVAKRYAPSLAFDPEGWRVDFGEIRVAMSKRERLELFEKERRLRLTNTVAFKMSENPDIDAEQAVSDLETNLEVETMLAVMSRPLAAVSGELGGAAAGADTAATEARAQKSEDDLSWVKGVVNAA